MAITPFDIFFEKNAVKSSSSKSSNLNAFSSVKIDYTTNTSLTGSNVKHNKSKIDKFKSPYLSEDKVQLLSRVTEKRFLHKNNDFMSSFPLAVNIYKANSDEFKSSKRSGKKVKKSVLTLPNEVAPLPHACTVSDMNDSEYFNDDKNDLKPKMRKAIQNKRKSRLRNRQINLYNTDVKYCSKLDIQIDKSSKEMGTKVAGDDKRNLRKTQKKQLRVHSDFNAHDVWSLLRKADHFKFRPSPPVSQESSLVSVKKNKRKKNKQRSSRKDSRLIETRTEEFAYITSFVDNPQNSCSFSSIDRVTVIEKQEELHTISNEIGTVQVDKSTVPFVFPYDNAKAQNTCRSKKSKSKQFRINTNNFEKISDHFPNNKTLVPLKTQGHDVTLKGADRKFKNNEIEFENDSDDNFMEFDVNMAQKHLCNDLDLNFSEKSDSSKEEIYITNKKNNEKESKQYVTGITKVVLSKGQNVVLTKPNTISKQDFFKKSRYSPSSRVTSISPKVNHSSMKISEIKRRLNRIKFPLVILGKDQLSSTVTVDNYDPPQFTGLDKHIWPFMRNWYNTDNSIFFDSIARDVNYNHQRINQNNETSNIRGTNNTNISSFSKVQNLISNDKYNAIHQINQLKPIDRNDNSLKKSLPHIKPMHRIKNRMMQFIHKKNVPENEVYNINDQKQNKDIQVSSGSVVDVGINTINNSFFSKQVNVFQTNSISKKDLKISKNVPPMNNTVKTKSKWASDFIENVIRKIKNGVYYYQEDKDKFKDQPKKTKEDGAQTETEQTKITDFNFPVRSQATVEETTVAEEMDSILSIPGFDNRLSGLEIETLNNLNQVAVKHCMTNIIIQFDVALSFESNKESLLQLQQSYHCIPITLRNHQPTIFKCKTTIINAILPAELCSILPKLMKKIISSNPDLALPTPVVDKVNSNLSTITEFTQSDSNDSNNYLMPAQIEHMTKIKGAIEGQISSTYISKNTSRRNMEIKSHKSFDLTDIKRLLSTVKMNLLPLGYINEINLLSYFDGSKPIFDDIVQSPKRLTTTCQTQTLQLYDFSSKKLLHSRDNYSFKRIVETILSSKTIILNLNSSCSNILKVVFYKTPINITFVTTKNSDINQLYSTIPNIDLCIGDLHNGEKDHLTNVDKFTVTTQLAPTKAITGKSGYLQISKPEKQKSVVEFCTHKTRSKKKGFVKLYKKCKSMSSISGNRTSTNLNKIINLEEFCLALGSGKMLSGVLDGNAERKILSAINEMKNWINDITPSQALLVLLLTNKKDTTNLVRYRPIILQGIAVNRITRVSELDMEIEVIERENLNKFIQYEGITYLPASEENQDNLLEELYWIAKTTASDYQKPFDESSERLLKSLLAKRKKLNPSYLRVMARYVGLGLLKTSK